MKQYNWRVDSFISRLSLLVLLSVIVLRVPCSDASEESIVFRVCLESQNNMPFIDGSTINGNVQFGSHGALPDLLMLAANEVKLELEFISLPWKRCIQELKQGKSDALFAAIWSQGRESWGVFPKVGSDIDNDLALWFGDYSVYSRIHSDLKWNGTDFSGVENGIGAPFGYIAYQKLERLKVLPARNIGANEAFPLLAKGRLDGYVIENTIGDRYIQEHDLGGDIVKLTPVFMEVHWFIPVSHQWYKDQKALTHRFWKVLAKIRKNEGNNLLIPYLENKPD